MFLPFYAPRMRQSTWILGGHVRVHVHAFVSMLVCGCMIQGLRRYACLKGDLLCRRLGTLAFSTYFRRSALLAQFNKLKKQYQQHILLFQVGDFYEIYGKDAGIYCFYVTGLSKH